MGLADLVKDALKGKGVRANLGQAQCPKCKAKVDLSLERCPNCGTRIASMFRMKCPECGAANPLDAKKCEKCGHDFETERAQLRTPKYRCPICGYEADYYMLSCPSCRTRFV